MVQWVRTGGDEALFDTITWINLTSSSFLVPLFLRHRLLMMFLKWGEVEFPSNKFSVEERAIREC